MYIYIYIYREREREREKSVANQGGHLAMIFWSPSLMSAVSPYLRMPSNKNTKSKLEVDKSETHEDLSTRITIASTSYKTFPSPLCFWVSPTAPATFLWSTSPSPLPPAPEPPPWRIHMPGVVFSYLFVSERALFVACNISHACLASVGSSLVRTKSLA